MKKIICLLLSLFILSGCNGSNINLDQYYDMIDVISSTEEFITLPTDYSFTFEVVDTSEGKRFYIIIDVPKQAMFDVKILAYEEGINPKMEFAPNAGIFGDKINLLPNQVNISSGYAKGISISGLLKRDNFSIYCLVQWTDNNKTKVYRDIYKLNKDSVTLMNNPLYIGNSLYAK